MHRQRGIATSFFKSIQITQTYCQKEERFTVQNKMIGASPQERTDPKNQAIHSSQILICHKERSAVQNQKTVGAIETALRLGGQRESVMIQPGKTHPKSKMLIRHKPLCAMKNGPEYKTRIRTGANNEPIAVTSWHTVRYIQITKRGLS